MKLPKLLLAISLIVSIAIAAVANAARHVSEVFVRDASDQDNKCCLAVSSLAATYNGSPIVTNTLATTSPCAECVRMNLYRWL